jgi:hypothetical protein
VGGIASTLKEPEPAIRNAIRNAAEDVQVDFLWSLWGDADSRGGEEEPDSPQIELPPSPED